MTMKTNREASSFRDPAGYIYYENNKVYRKIFKEYFKQYDHLMNSGLYEELANKNMIISHEEVERNNDYIIIEVKKIPYISYPYEWGFEQMKDASLLMLNINLIAMKYGMILKDASGYNIQFYNGTPTFIDTLSFEFYGEGEPWGAYGQFIRHFMGPLLLMNNVDERLNCLLKNYIDGIPVDLADALLKGRGGFTARQHITWHNKSIKNYSDVKTENKMVKISKIQLTQMIEMMTRQINKMSRRNSESEWENYYSNTNYDEIAEKNKIEIIKDYINNIPFEKEDILYDLGANDGKYSRIASSKVNTVISFDYDLNCINNNYNLVKRNEETNILPLFLDITNPTPAIGYGLTERQSINERSNIKCVMALALIHHISISNNVHFDNVCEWFSQLGEYLIIEFVPKDDSKVQKLLSTRKDIFDWYTIEQFENSMKEKYTIMKKSLLKNSKRVIYLMRKKYE